MKKHIFEVSCLLYSNKLFVILSAYFENLHNKGDISGPLAVACSKTQYMLQQKMKNQLNIHIDLL